MEDEEDEDEDEGDLEATPKEVRPTHGNNTMIIIIKDDI